MKLATLLLVSLLAASAARAADPTPVDAGWLVSELRKGGYLVFFRHTSTFRDSATMELEARNVASGRLVLADCATQRNLNERGVLEAGRQAAIVRELAIPYGAVYASKYCRARDHVRWFTDRVTLNDALTPTRNGLSACCSAKRASVWLPLRSVSPGAMPATLSRGAKAWAKSLVRPCRPTFDSV